MSLPLVVTDDTNPRGIAVDSVNDHLFWITWVSNVPHYRLMVSDLQGSNRTILLDDANAWILQIHTRNGWLYMRGWKLQRCKVDGSSLEEIIEVDNRVIDISIDELNDRLYWVDDWPTNFIKSASLDGSDVKKIKIMQNGYTITTLFAHEDYIYFYIYNNGHILMRTDKSDGNGTYLIYTANDWISDMLVYNIDGPCWEYKSIRDENKSSAGYSLDLEDDVINDEELQENWYRVYSDNGDDMPTSPPGVGHCGTRNPIWLNGTLPDDDDGNVTRTACVQTVNNICEQTIDIEIRKCYGYYLYYLHNTTENSSYCFGSGQVACPSGFSSESGFYPGCSSNFPKDVTLVSVKVELADGNPLPITGHGETPSLIPVFRCHFTEESDVNHFYDVYWYINGNDVFNNTNIPFSDIRSTDLLHDAWIDTYKMNMEVKCAVRSRFSVNSTPSPIIYSSEFQAGLFPEKYEYTVIEGESISINLVSTVPIGCIASHDTLKSKCSQNFYIYQPNVNRNIASCTNNVAIKDIVFNAQFCGVSIKTIDWWEKRMLKVYGYNDGLYNTNDRSTLIKIGTSSISLMNDIWADVKIPEIKVTVIDKDFVLTKRLCQSYNDPHITTFDGRYYDYMAVGEFVMYKNGPFSVHALFSNCISGRAGAACHCGVAIRSRNSLFVVRTCSKVSRTQKFLLPQPIIKLVRCEESDLLITENGQNYKVKLPIGTEIRFSISRWSSFISMISIKPVFYDINKAKGLCGILSTTKDSSDDFTDPTNVLMNDVKSFGDSWKVTKASEQLFIAKPEFLSQTSVTISDTTVDDTDSTAHYCTCEKEAGTTDLFDEFNNVQCNMTESTEFCIGSSESTSSNAFYTSCTNSNRRKRSAYFNHKIVKRSTSDSDDILDFPSLEYDDDVYSSEEAVNITFINGWTEEKAYEKCNETIRNAFPVDLLADYVNLDDDGFIESCVSDIKVAGDDSFLSDTLLAITTTVTMEVVKNETLYTLKTENGSQTVLDFLTSFLCPSNCSSHGNCTSGVCSCYEGYIGDDCSEHISTPPSAISIPFDGLCTLGTRECKRTNINGYFSSAEVWYKIKHFQIYENFTLYSHGERISIAEYRNSFMVTVELFVPDVNITNLEAMAEGYEISMSNDRIHFGENVTIIIYDETLYQCNKSTIVCTVMETYTTSTVTPANSEDDIRVPIVTSITVFVVVFVLAVGLFFLKSTHSKKKIGSLKDQNAGEVVSVQPMPTSDNWLARQTTVSDLDLEIE